MSLATGARLGPYEMLGLLGAGGMGEVYRARDTKLQRDVAIKILPELFAADPEHLARFQREAHVLASLNHPNIAAIYGFEESGDTRALVLELVDGPTLADRIAQGPIPLDEALPIARQIAEALEVAHEHGIIHRDLKPANIKLRTDGTVKVLDFGLAKAIDVAAAPAALSMSPTITSPAATRIGVILGTAAYMSPEQARGKPVDRRADIWAFGCVLYEMLTGRRPFAGDEVTDVLARVIERDPDLALLPAATPEPIRRLLRRCLEKDPRERLPHIGIARTEIRDAQTTPASERTPAGSLGTTGRLAFATAVAFTVIVAAFTALRTAPDATTPAWGAGPIRFTISLPQGVRLDTGYDVPFAVSPDGLRIVFSAVSANGRRQLWLRNLDSDIAQPIAGTDGGVAPFWSPDGGSIGFKADGLLKRVARSGGTPQTIAPALEAGGADWSSDGVVVFSADAAALSRAPVTGGEVSAASVLDATRGDSWHVWPQFLRDDRRFLYGANGRGFTILVGSLDGSDARVVAQLELDRRSTLRVVPGWMLFVHDAALFAQPFDQERLELSGEPVRLLDGVPISAYGRAPFSVSSNGVLAYSPVLVGDPYVLRWFDRDGTSADAVTTPARYQGFALAPDGRRLAFSRFDERGARDIWVRDLLSGGESKVTSDGDSSNPIWAADGQRIVFASARNNPPNLFTKRVDGGEDEQRTTSPLENYPTAWSADGSTIVYEVHDARTGSDLWRLSVDTNTPEPLSLNTRFNDIAGALSPDGRWLAYAFDQSGRGEIWVASFPDARVRRQVSVGGGASPAWRSDTKELFYLSADGQLMAVAFEGVDDDFVAGVPNPLFRVGTPAYEEARAGDRRAFTVTPDGRRFLVAVPARETESPPIHVVLNWPAMLSPR